MATIKTKFIIGAVFVAVTVISLGIGANYTAQKLEDGLAVSQIIAQARVNHMQGDMMHDALRGDLFAALAAAQEGDQAAMTTAATETDNHAKEFLDAVQSNKALELSVEARKSLDAVDGPLRAYIEVAKETVALALRDPVAAQAHMSVFSAKFADLEEKMGAASDALQSYQDTKLAAIEKDAQFKIWVLEAGACVAGLVVLMIAVMGIRSVVRPVRTIAAITRQIADGRYDTEIPFKGRKDEIGDLADAVQVLKMNGLRAKELEDEAEQQRTRSEQEKRQMMHKLADDFEASVKGVVNTVASSATEMKASSDTLGRTASDTSSRATTVAAAATQASSNVQTVASATEELTASIREISSQVQTSARTAQSAVAKASQTNQKVTELAEASQRIGEVVQLISEIANQTNLLALNATIEAARAGEAGKGFAVVASEVKNLASQTAKATEEISAQIAAMQAATGETVGAIREISDTIKELDQVAAAIAAAVEEQGSATQEIARNVQEAARGTGDVTANIEAVSMAAGETGSAAGELQSAAEELSHQAEKLREGVDAFISKVRTA